MVGRCVELWSSKVYNKYKDLGREVRTYITETEQVQLQTLIEGMFNNGTNCSGIM